MKNFRFSTTAFCLTGAMFFAGACIAQTTPAAPKGEGVVASAEVTATVTKVDQATREVTLKSETGEEYSFIASEDVKNLPQVKVGDVLTATYAEAFVYEVKKGGKVAQN